MRKVSLFIPCTVDLFLPRIGEASCHLLQHLGVQAVYHLEQTCCGQPAINAGYTEQARKAAKHFINVFGGGEAIVSPSGSCVCTVKYHYPELLQDEPGWLKRAEALASRIYEITEYIVDVLGIEDCGMVFNGKVAYHESCHILRGLGVSSQPKKLITNIKGAELIALRGADSCCGFGGEFANRYPDISNAMVKEKCDNFRDSGADVMLLCEPGCLLNIGGYLSRNDPGRKVMHVADFFASLLPERPESERKG